MADHTRLKQALLNLLSNAIKYNREGGSVTIEAQPAGKERLRISVTDTGSGIPADRMHELFQPFNRLNAAKSAIEGTGIGLTITRRIVEMMGGSVDVKSEAGAGSTFWIELPIAAMSEANAGQPRTANSGTPETQDAAAAKHTVLYIEDNPSNLELVALILGKLKQVHLLTAPAPELGIELALAHIPELILLDINMPQMDGYQVLQVLKGDSRTKDIPVIAISANAMPRDIERGKEAGFADYLTKPFDVRHLLQVVEKMLSIS
jgi:CheY-like chemotaxis protein/anti-sigma regulatory factor (Ser/Thr protein kinase)